LLSPIAGDRVKVLGEAYTPDDDEDMAFATVSNLWIPRGRSRTEVMMARAGNWVLLGGVDADIVKTATIVGAGSSSFGGDDGDGEIHIFSPLKFPQVSLSLLPTRQDSFRSYWFA
jgi:U5 small nuclear ribonucleoprotein component